MTTNTSSSGRSQPHVLAVPLPFQGHIHPLMEFSKKLLSAGFMVTFANTQANHKRIKAGFCNQQKKGGGGDDNEEEEEEEEGDFHLVSLEEGISEELESVLDIITEVLKPKMSAAVAQLLARLCEKAPPVTLLVFDFRLAFLLDVALAAAIPSLSFWTQSAANFACNLLVVQGFQLPPDDSTLITCVQGVPPFKSSEITGVCIDQAPPPFPTMKYGWEPFKRVHEPKWIAFNTFEELEATTLNTLHIFLRLGSHKAAEETWKACKPIISCHLDLAVHIGRQNRRGKGAT